MNVNFDPGPFPKVTVPTTPVAKVAAPVARPGQQRASGQDEPSTAPHAARQADLGETVARLQDHVQTLHRELHFRVDEVTGQIVVRVVDTDTGELVRQIPRQEALDMLQIIETLQAGGGLLLREQA